MRNDREKIALLSVTDKTGIVDFASQLENHRFRILSTGGTGDVLEQAGVDVISVADWTESPEMLGGRVKTLHPAIHAGILARRDDDAQMKELEEYDIRPIDMVVVNLYEFENALRQGKTGEELTEEIDIGGPTMMRAAAKNHHAVTVVSNPDQYDEVLEDLNANDGTVPKDRRKELAESAFRRTAAYDRTIHESLSDKEAELLPEEVTLSLSRERRLRYGENPHQEGGLYRNSEESRGGFPDGATSIHGKELSYNNLMDMDAAYRLLYDLGNERPACTVIKHLIPCGAGRADTGMEAFRRAHAGDPVSAFGSIVGFNVPLTRDLARRLADDDYYIEGIIAPEIEEGAVEEFEDGPGWGDRVRLVPVGEIHSETGGAKNAEVRSLTGGYLIQQKDAEVWPDEGVDVVAGSLDDAGMEELKFAWTVCKHVRSNAIVLARGSSVVGVGAGQPSRVDSAKIAVEKAGDRAEGAVMASDAFFPFPDALEVGIDAGVKAAVQPGGSVNDDRVIATARERGISMVMTGQRHFRH